MIVRLPLIPLTIALGVAALVAGCGLVGVASHTDNTFQVWSNHPLVPDPALAREALNTRSACLMDAPAAQVRILLEDRRTPRTAAFLVATPTMIGSCLVTSGTGASSGGGGPRPGAITGAISVDANASGGTAEAQARLLGGRVVGRASQVVVALADGRALVASLDNGYWLAWWPDTTSATTVTATDPSGAELGSVEVVE